MSVPVNSMTTLMNEKNAVANTTDTGKASGSNVSKVSSRRKFLGQVGAVLTGGAVFGNAALASASPADVINRALAEFGNDVAISFSGAEDVVLIEYAAQSKKPTSTTSVIDHTFQRGKSSI